MLSPLLVGETGNVFVQLIRYTIVGALAFVVDFGALFVFTEYAGLHYLVSAALAFGLGVTTNYCLSVLWVFDKRTVGNAGIEFLIFALLGIMGLGINELLLFTLTEFAGLHYLGSKVVATGLTYVWNFVSRKVLLFTIAPARAEAALAGNRRAHVLQTKLETQSPKVVRAREASDHVHVLR
jgi:putative flippase GtrA